MTRSSQPNLSTREAAEILGRHEVTLRQWRRRDPMRGPKPVKVGGEWRYSEAEVRDYARHGEQVAS